MKTTIALLAIGLFIAGCGQQKAAQETVQQPAATDLSTAETVTGNFGDKITEDGAIEANQLLASMKGADSMNVKVKGKIVECCKKKGCWMTVDLGNDQLMRVSFKDYAFFVPKNADGKEAVFQGMVRKEKVDEAALKHYAEDAGKSKEEIAKIDAPQDQLVFEASGVIIK